MPMPQLLQILPMPGCACVGEEKCQVHLLTSPNTANKYVTLKMNIGCEFLIVVMYL